MELGNLGLREYPRIGLLHVKNSNVAASVNVVPCSDMAGEVIAVGKNVIKWKVGDRVCPNFSPVHLLISTKSIRDLHAPQRVRKTRILFADMSIWSVSFGGNHQGSIRWTF
jgi:NADPH:quinone reductase-like Zn-dependent oxidoreductase